jgi:hypothetical protein
MPVSPHRLEEVMSEAMQLISSDPRLGRDPLLRYDTLEGNSRFFAALDDVAELAIADAKLVEIGKERLKRIEARASKSRDVMKRMLEGVDLTNADRPLYTATIATRRELAPIDEALLPDEWWRRAPDKVAIKKALNAGQKVAGAVLDNGETHLVLRTL